MAAAKLLLLFSLFMLPFFQCENLNLPLVRVITSLERLVAFYKENYRDLNLDGLYGLRVLEGHLQLILSQHKNGSHLQLTSDILSRLQAMSSESSFVCNQALEYVRSDDEKYFNSMNYVIDKPWDILRKHRSLDPELRWKPKIYRASKDFTIDEVKSDKCMGEITGNNKDKKKCVVSKECLDMMTMKGLTEYGITHQLLWTMLAEKANCLQELGSLLGSAKETSVDNLQLEFCTNNFFEMAAVVHVYMESVIKVDYQDLFLEQQFVCPSLGFHEFLKKEYLDQILSWQYKRGCFKHPSDRADKKQTSKLDKTVRRQKGEQQNKLFVKNLENVVNKLPQNPVPNNANPQPVNNRQTVFIPRVRQQIIPNVLRQDNVARSNLDHLNRVNNQQPVFVNNQLQQMFINKQPQQQFVNNNKQPLFANKQSANQVIINNNNRLLVPKQHQLVYQQQRQQQPRYNVNNARVGRRLLVEKEMKEGCMAHTTAVATGALVMYLRYLIDPGPMDFFGEHHILQDTSRSLLGPAEDDKPNNGGDSRKVKQEGFLPVQQDDLDPNINLNPDQDGDHLNANEIIEEEEEEEEEDDDEEDEYKEADGDEDPDYDNEENNDEDFYPDADNKDKNKHPVVHFGADPKDVGFHKNVLEGQDNDIKNVKTNDEGDYTYYEEDSDRKNIHPNKNIVEIKAIDNNNNNKNNIDNFNNDIEQKAAVYTSDNVTQSIPSSVRPSFVFVTVCCFVLLLFMFRFIKKRRIHIRYHARSFFRL